MMELIRLLDSNLENQPFIFLILVGVIALITWFSFWFIRLLKKEHKDEKIVIRTAHKEDLETLKAENKKILGQLLDIQARSLDINNDLRQALSKIIEMNMQKQLDDKIGNKQQELFFTNLSEKLDSSFTDLKAMIRTLKDQP